MYCWFSRISVTLSNMACSRPYHLFVSIHHADTITYKVVYLSFPIAFRVLFLKRNTWNGLTYLPILARVSSYEPPK